MGMAVAQPRGALMADARIGPRFGYAVNLLTIVVFALFLCFALIRLAGTERQMRLEAGQNMVWVLSQSQREVLRLEAAVARHLAGLSLPNGDLELYFDLLLSRLNLLDQIPQQLALQGLGLADQIGAAALEVRRLEALLPAVQNGSLEAGEEFAAVLQTLATLFNRAANAA